FVPHSDRLLTRLENGGPCRVVCPAVEADRIAHTDHAADHDRPEHAPVPVRLHGIPPSGPRLVHAFARPGLAADGAHAFPDAQQAVAAVGESHAGDHEVRPACGWIEVRTEL